MELKLSPISSSGLSPPDFVSDPEELEVSDEDNADRNHKHRRRETESHSLESNEPEQFSSRYRKCNKPFENGQSFRQFDPHSAQRLGKKFPSNFDKRRAFSGNFSRSPFDRIQRMNGNKQFATDFGYGRGRVKDSVLWSQPNMRFPMVDIVPPLMHPGSIRTAAMFAGRGLHTVSNTQSASWGGSFGLLPRISNGGIDMVHPFGLQGSLRPPFNNSLSMAIPRQQCRDFEERGFCLKGDMCSMEHGMNRIVVEDVQSLSQFNLPVSLPSVHVMGQAGRRVAASVDASSSAFISSKGPHGRCSKSAGVDEGCTLDSVHPGALDVSGTDVYDPDQPLWNSDFPETSSAHVASQSSNMDAAECLMDAVSFAGHQSTSSSVQGKINSSKKRSFLQEKADSILNSSDLAREKHDVSTVSEMTMQHPRKRAKVGDYVDSCLRQPVDKGCSARRPVQKASVLRTLFINGIPLKDNKREALLSHFRKFGEVISIYIPSNCERAFVQFSKREDAERALKSPDAVMGNRFIKMWWANRDNIVDDRTAAGSDEPLKPHQKSDVLNTAYGSAMKSKDSSHATASKVNMANALKNPRVDDGGGPKLQTPVGSRAPVSVLKKLDSLDSLKEQIRKKQEMLEQKRNEFRQQLEKLQKHAPGVKGEVRAATETAKLQILGSSADPVKAESDGALHKPQIGSIPNMEEQSNSKLEAPPARHFGDPFPINRYKLDNRPSSFFVDRLSPADLANVNALREHFASFGDLSNVEVEDSGVQNNGGDGKGCSDTSKNVSVRASFKTRQAAERAFMHGKTWHGRVLKFAWIVAPANLSESQSEEDAPCPKGLVDTKVQFAEKPGTNRRGSPSTVMKEASGVDTQYKGNSDWDALGALHLENGNSSVVSVSSTVEALYKNISDCSSPEEANGFG